MGTTEYDIDYGKRVAERRAEILDRVAEAARAAGRDPQDVTVCAVSKTVDVDKVAAARAAGYRAFGENRPQELTRKLDLLRGDPAFEGVAWHMIGNLQENKINRVLEDAPVLIHSISSPELAAAVSKRALVHGTVQPVLLEVNVSGEQSKSGMAPEVVRERFAELAGLEGIAVRGLMTMAPQGDAAVAERTFEGLRMLLEELRCAAADPAALTELSMGMSEDFREAVGQGATIVRLGRVAFDPEFPLG